MEKEEDLFVPRQVTTEENFASGHRACIGCGEALAVRHVCKALGKNVIIVTATGCIEIFSSLLPQTSWQMAWIHTLFENVAAVMSGIESAYKVRVRKGKIPDKNVKFVGFGGDGATTDIGLQALSGAMERGHDFLYVCYDNEAYMNTGIQRSSSTPYGAWTTTAPVGKKSSIGQVTWKKNMPEIAVAHNIPYVATACPSYPLDLMAKVKRGAEMDGPAYIHILSVCPTGWRSPTDITIELGRLAVETGVFPLYEVINGEYNLSVDLPDLKPVTEYLKKQGRFKHLNDDTIATIQTRVEEDYVKLREKAGVK
ncbi:MAG: pyruvate synthase subunit PorB [Halobacteriota archaeon]|uniref:Pyruvate synthase subunit PorB n=1 Tax=Candidatus Methanophaga sp. ANME-1 ERB7 TaxID=2759913 RepID=A0A7G9Z9V4_9EURY|nr:pyruvate synthase subunit PorB [Methanosarcinales archaeon ANME-1 ERB7]